MDSRWPAAGFALLFGALAAGFIVQEKVLQALVAALHTLVALGFIWWYRKYDGPRSSGSADSATSDRIDQ